jgi:hypothetical protein
LRSYRDGQQSKLAWGEKDHQNRKPIFRSSALFPILEKNSISTEIGFLGYWVLKRNIKEVGMVISMRGADGNLLQRKQETITEAKSFRIVAKDWLDELEIAPSTEFIGSIELEVFSSQDMVFPYPAFVLTFHGEGFSTATHTTGRIYNDLEDLEGNSQVLVPETGFDVHSAKGFDPFFIFTNGSKPNTCGNIDYRLVGEQKVVEDSFQLGKIDPFETRFVMLKEYMDLETLLDGEKGTISLRHNFEGFFPRFVSGNFEDDQKAISITHTFFDSSEIDSDDAYILPPVNDLYHSSDLLPFFSKNGTYSQLVLYPCSSPSCFALRFLYINQAGKLLGDVMVDENIVNSKSLFQTFDFGDIAQSNNIQLDEIASVKVVAEYDGKIASRLKLGLNIGQKNQKYQLPCNICFAAEGGDDRKLDKPGTFKWLPILNKGNSVLAITNSGTNRSYERNADVKLSFYREDDAECITRDFTLGPDQMHTVETDNDEELRGFLGTGTGWATAVSNNGFVKAWYFDLGRNGIVAGDHSF